jgi:hypothetical protein
MRNNTLIANKQHKTYEALKSFCKGPILDYSIRVRWNRMVNSASEIYSS